MCVCICVCIILLLVWCVSMCVFVCTVRVCVCVSKQSLHVDSSSLLWDGLETVVFQCCTEWVGMHSGEKMHACWGGKTRLPIHAAKLQVLAQTLKHQNLNPAVNQAVSLCCCVACLLSPPTSSVSDVHEKCGRLQIQNVFFKRIF